jgi:GNAT superfamily N-acetyltransferase
VKFSIRRAEDADAEPACRVLRRSIEECCIADHHSAPGILSAWLGNKTPENLRSWINSKGYAVVAQAEGGIVGVAMLSEGGMVILNYLIPEARFHGMGRAMLDALEIEARTRGFKELELTSTATAYEFYRRNGYTDTGEVSTMFGLTSPGMRKTLPVHPKAP